MSGSAIAVKRLHKLEGDGKLKAFADVAIADLFLVKGLRVVEGKNGLFVSMPSEQGKNGQWYPTIFPLSDEVKSQLNEAVLEAYQEQ
ncbi:MAG: septation protein spoVG [Candidatus Omnitrophica bacterium CG11_big_fil_rev_8_21_14_0_20_42_13]|uniref:Septation protein spoVG n=1 Tax=Candidatus Ghiorseimicrobium undicola TaxID=1974746 RepID=A0A2H0LVI6_9BACT|nr:MAG: septation protein spoVG [Candidatus Omnitrophica bacterium CG11_big_fil_rev_8_21_14_0_20_42_13]